MNSGEFRLTPLDGLRFFAFLAVFLSHFPPPAAGWNVIGTRGWGGVDLFFALSSYLLLTLMQREFEFAGRIDLGAFFWRRMLRIQPLMMAYTAAAILFLSSNDVRDWLRFGGLLLGLDNILFVSGVIGSAVPYARHLWSLSYEFQLYIALPALFFARDRLTDRQFLKLLCAIALYGAAARLVANGLGAIHPFVYRLPIFRPESFLAGVALWAIKPRWNVLLSLSAGVTCWLVFILLPQPWENQVAGLLSYPALALACGAAIDCSLRIEHLAAALGSPFCRYFGRRSFGLYVFHLIAGDAGQSLVRQAGFSSNGVLDWLVATAIGFGICVAFADLSFRFVETPFNRMAARLRPGSQVASRLEARTAP